MSKVYTDEIMMNGAPMGMGMPMDPNMMNGGMNPTGMPPMQYTKTPDRNRFDGYNTGSAPMNKKIYNDMSKSQKPPKYSKEPIEP
jgi:hypothetical protein